VYNIIVDVNLVLIDNRLSAVQIPKNISIERLDGGSPLALPTEIARRVSDSEAYRTQYMLIDLNIK